MTVQCASCANFTLQNRDGYQGRTMAEAGFGTCNRSTVAGRYESARFERHCHMFAEADKTTIIKRADWLERQERDTAVAKQQTVAREAVREVENEIDSMDDFAVRERASKWVRHPSDGGDRLL